MYQQIADKSGGGWRSADGKVKMTENFKVRF